ncbi:hypothetical protein RISK_006697 [Rhodopirellula islandica]|uniref:Uncharacterized protein n=1 Tax=Rhodopirellula islandica TaxID=595434 RepID=A0A0J1B3D5_RHOIS|nr:hypothetical protein RISK_006697 [Rhodopirellula islandica]
MVRCAMRIQSTVQREGRGKSIRTIANEDNLDQLEIRCLNE